MYEYYQWAPTNYKTYYSTGTSTAVFIEPANASYSYFDFKKYHQQNWEKPFLDDDFLNYYKNVLYPELGKGPLADIEEMFDEGLDL